MPRPATAKITVLVQPGASRNSLVSCQNGTWRIKIAAPPVKGKANRELISFLSNILGIGKSHLTIEKGSTSHRKLLAVTGLTQQQVDSLLQKALG